MGQSLQAVDPWDRPSCIGLIHCLSEVEAARTQIIDTRAIPPHPSINCVKLMFEMLAQDRNSVALEVRKLLTNP
eukprot:9483308-Pyramimonas_sp.AAC.2